MSNTNPDGAVGKRRTDCITSGKRLNSELNQKLTAIQSGSQRLVDAENRISFNEISGYKLTTHDIYKMTDPERRGPDRTVLKMFSDLNLDESTDFICADVHSLGPSHDHLERLVAQNSFSQGGRDGLIIAENNDMKKSNITPAPDRIDHWSKLFFQVIKNIYHPNDVPEIKYILRDMIGNPSTRERIKEAHGKHQSKVSGGKAAFDASTSDAVELETYYSLLGSPNGVGIAYLLKDYPATFRIRKIVKIHTWMNLLSPDQPNSGLSKFALAFELAPA